MQRMPTRNAARRAAGVILALLVLGAALVAPHTASAQSGYTYQECQTVDADALGAEIETLALDVLQAEGATIDVPAMVARQWQAMGMDTVIAQEVDVAVAALMVEEPYWKRFLSGWSASQAEELTNAVAARAFGSEAMAAALDTLAGGVAEELAQELEAAAAASASTSLLCLQEYVGEQYSATLFALFTEEITADVEAVDYRAAGADYTFSAAGIHNKALAGAGIIIVSQVVRTVSVKLGQRIAGRVAGRIAGRLLGRLGSSLIPIAGWVIGGGLLIWDLVEGGHGALPQIAAALTSPEMADTMRAEVSAAVREGLDEQMHVMAGAIAASMVDEWDGFCTRHPTLCSLPEESADFRAILDDTPVDQLDKLAALVDVYMDATGRADLDAAVTSGLFETLLDLPAESYTILAVTGAPDLAVAWSALAGPRLADVVNTGLYQLVTPEAVSALDVELLLALETPAQMAAVTALPSDARGTLLTLPVATLNELTARFDRDELAAVVDGAAARGMSVQTAAVDLLAGAVTLAELTAPPAPPEAAHANAAVADRASAPTANETPATSGIFGLDMVRRNSVLMAALGLSVVLAISAFALIAASSVKRNKH